MASPDYLHPEFGVFCPTPRLRRDLRVVSISILLGAIAGAVAVSVLNAGRERSAEAALPAPVATVGAEVPSAPEQLHLAGTEGRNPKPEAGKPAPSNAEPVATSTGMGMPSSVAAITPDASKGSIRPDAMQPGSEAVPDGATGTQSQPGVASIPPPPAARSEPHVVVPKKPRKTARADRRGRFETGDDRNWRGGSGGRGIARYEGRAELDRRGSVARVVRSPSSTATIFWSR